MTAPIPPPGFWSCFSGVEGTDHSVRYRDVLGVKYAYDATVVNHKSLRTGDVLLIRDRDWVYGHGTVGQVVAEQSTKTMIRCPACQRSGPSLRVNKVPRYRCPKCHAEFESPDVEQMALLRYEAWYDDSWVELPTPLPRTALDGAYAGADRQNAIRALKPAAAAALLRDHTTAEGLAQLRDAAAPVAPDGGHAEAVGRRRLGQKEFKRLMVERFGNTCAFTGPQPAEILDAAHLYRFADTPEHHVDGGLLLRSDIHRLFDAFLVTVDTASWTLIVTTDLCAYADLDALNGTALRVPVRARPAAKWLDAHRAEVQRRATSSRQTAPAQSVSR